MSSGRRGISLCLPICLPISPDVSRYLPISPYMSSSRRGISLCLPMSPDISRYLPICPRAGAAAHPAGLLPERGVPSVLRCRPPLLCRDELPPQAEPAGVLRPAGGGAAPCKGAGAARRRPARASPPACLGQHGRVGKQPRRRAARAAAARAGPRLLPDARQVLGRDARRGAPLALPAVRGAALLALASSAGRALGVAAEVDARRRRRTALGRPHRRQAGGRSRLRHAPRRPRPRQPPRATARRRARARRMPGR